MPSRTFRLFGLVAAVALLAGCPKPPPAPPPVASAEPVVEAPPPPKCEALSEACKATASTRAKVANSELTFTPVVGWVYAQQSSATIAQLSNTGATIAFLGFDFDPKDQKKENATRDAVFAELVKQIGISPPKRKLAWKVPEDKKDKKELKDLKIGLWELSDPAIRDKAKGSILIVEGSVSPGKGVIGVSFVPSDDSTTPPALLESISSLGKAQ